MNHHFGKLWVNVGAVLLLSVAAVSRAEIVDLEGAVEAMRLEVRVDASANGYAVGSQCAECDLQRFRITPATVYLRNNVPVEAGRASSFSGKPGTIIYNLESREVTKIIQ